MKGVLISSLPWKPLSYQPQSSEAACTTPASREDGQAVCQASFSRARDDSERCVSHHVQRGTPACVVRGVPSISAKIRWGLGAAGRAAASCATKSAVNAIMCVHILTVAALFKTRCCQQVCVARGRAPAVHARARARARARTLYIAVGTWRLLFVFRLRLRDRMHPHNTGAIDFKTKLTGFRNVW